MADRYPLAVEDQRILPEGYDGNVFVWDIDKTYLSTRFSSMRGMARIPIEFAVDKHAIPGMPEVLRGLRRGPGPDFACAPLYFVSASPPLLRKVVENKMLLDGVEHDGITFKDWLGTLRQLRPGRLREQVGFKVNALLDGRLRRPRAREYLFGDDVERDAEAFSIYARLVNDDPPSRAIARYGGRRPAPDELESSLQAAGVKPDDRRFVHDLAGRLPAERGRVERFFIHLELGSPPDSFDRYGELAVPVKGGFQLALALHDLGLLDKDAVTGAAEAVEASAKARSKYGAPPEQAADALRRGLIRQDRLVSLGY